jgi:hypothetical protein
MSGEAEIRFKGMQALIGALGLVDAERPMAATSNQEERARRCRAQSLKRKIVPRLF